MYLDVWDELTAMERRLDDVFRTFVGPRARLTFPELPTGIRRPFVPPVDVFSKNGGLVIRAGLPGIDPTKDVSVTFEPGAVVIRGVRKHDEAIKEQDYVRMETFYGAFERHVPLPEGVDEKKVTAEYKDGLLEITVPVTKRMEVGTTKSIPIKTTAKAVKAA